MSNSIVPDSQPGYWSRAATAIGTANPVLIAYIVFMVCLTLTVVF